MNNPIVVSFSGGKDSTFTGFELLERGYNVHSFAFFDTEWDFPEMADHIAQVEEYTGVPVVTLKHDKPLLFEMTERVVWHHKTKIKTRALKKYVKSIPGAKCAVGFAADEIHRTQTKTALADKAWKIYPMIEWGVVEADALAYCRDRGFHWGGLYDHFDRVSCFCCPLQKLEYLRIIRREFPQHWATMLEWDAMIKHNTGFKGTSTVHELDARFEYEESMMAHAV